MTDDLDRAVDAQINAYRPDLIPPFSAMEGRKRARDRRRIAVGAGALSVIALVGGSLLVPSLTGGGDRLTPSQGGPALTYTAQTGTDPQTGEPTRRYTLPTTLARTAESGLVPCRGLDGVTTMQLSSDPPQNIAIVTGSRQIEAFEACVAAVPGLRIPELAETTDGDAIDANAPAVTFRVSSNGAADPAAYTAAVDKCLGLAGVAGSSVQESYPATYELRAAASDADADALRRCLNGVPGAIVDATGTTASDCVYTDVPGTPCGEEKPPAALTEAQRTFVESCVGQENALPAPGWVGMSESEIEAFELPKIRPRLVGRDGECLGRDRSRRDDRVNVIIEDDTVIWAGRF